MSMADDRAAVKIDGKLVVLQPARGAKDLFPFTFDKWTNSDGMTITVREISAARQVGTEAMESPALIEMVEGGEKHAWTGRLSCGS